MATWDSFGDKNWDILVLSMLRGRRAYWGYLLVKVSRIREDFLWSDSGREFETSEILFSSIACCLCFMDLDLEFNFVYILYYFRKN